MVLGVAAGEPSPFLDCFRAPIQRQPAQIADRALAQVNAAGLLIFDVTCPACETEAPMRLDPLRLLRAEAARAGDIAAAGALSARLGWPLSQVLDLPNAHRRALSRLVSEVAA